jgi:hypothetical protein
LLGFAWAPGAVVAQPFFEAVTDQAFNSSYNPAQALSFGDYNNDGWPDLFLAEGRTATGQSKLIRGVSLLQNEGQGRFADRRDLLPADLAVVAKGAGAVFGDYDNDGDLDLYVPTGAWWSRGRDRLLRNDRGLFRDVSLEAGLLDSLPTDNAIWLDYDREGIWICTPATGSSAIYKIPRWISPRCATRCIATGAMAPLKRRRKRPDWGRVCMLVRSGRF